MNFAAAYNRQDYLDFFTHTFLPDDFKLADERIVPDFSTAYIRQITKIGESRLLDCIVLEIVHESENDPRVGLSKESFRLMAQYSKKRALALFISPKSKNYRLSLITIDLKWDDGKRVEKEYSNPRRFSFFLGADAKLHTPQSYLERKGRIKDFDDLKSRFSIEVVNKEFYSKIADLFTELAGGIRKAGKETIKKKGLLIYPDGDENNRKEFAVRLIGRLVFCWFLKKKHSDAGVSLVSEKLLSLESLKVGGKGGIGYYHSILEPLFFEVLNTPVDQRKNPYTKDLWAQIPFLNGGLFTPHDDDYYKSGQPGIPENIGILKVPDKWLSSLFEIFETYNFTIDENTPVDVELAIEPEMLGRIFENLLAEINPETGETARKATGSYYTPRAIVEYMVDESIKQYLATKTGLADDKLAALLSYADEDGSQLSDSQKDSILDALDTIKIIDPACGSGAFPMGVLHKILLILQKIDPDSTKWLDKILANVKDPLVVRDLKKKIDQPNYLHKLGIIRDCIYGVDIQPIAVEISKLRFFLSLVVDENVSDKEPNRGVKPLPNLEFKFVCANTLIGLPKAEIEKAKTSGKKVTEFKGQSLIFEATDEISNLKRLRDEYLNSYGNEKKNIEEKFRKVQSKMFEHSLDWKGKESQTLKLAMWNPFSHESNPWFDPEWMFGIKDGFDIAIANPPYLDSETMSRNMPEMRIIYSQLFTSAKGNWDIFIPFIEKGVSLLKTNGAISYIVPNKLIAANYSTTLREFLLNFQIKELRDLSSVKVFTEADVYPLVFLVVNSCEKLPVKMTVMSSVEELQTQNTIMPNLFYADIYWDKYYANPNIISIFEKFAKFKPLSELSLEVSGAATVSEAYKLKEFIKERKDLTAKKYKKLINTGTIDPFCSLWGLISMRYLKDSYQEPTIEDSVLQSNFPRRYDQAEQCKIILGGMTRALECFYDDGKFLACKSTFLITPTNKDAIDLKALTAILNSRLITFWYANYFKSQSLAGGYLQVNPESIRMIPLPNFTSEQIRNLTILSEKLIALNGTDKQAKVKEYEREIDQLVYKLYDLTADEIAIVEGTGSARRKACNDFGL